MQRFPRILSSGVAFVPALLLALELLSPIEGATYKVGPGKSCKRLHDVPWSSLKAGDTVLIYWRSAPYRERLLICARGTEKAPITIRGVPGPNRKLPVIDGRDAAAAPEPGTWDNGRSVVQIGNANYEPGALPAHIHIERYIPQTLLAPYCDVVITAGGFGTIMSALQDGLPLVLVPVGADQPLNARRCAVIGVGRAIAPDERVAIGNARRDELLDRREVEEHFSAP